MLGNTDDHNTPIYSANQNLQSKTCRHKITRETDGQILKASHRRKSYPNNILSFGKNGPLTVFIFLQDEV